MHQSPVKKEMQCKNVQKQSILSPESFTNNDNQVHEHSVQTINSLFSTFTLNTKYHTNV